MSSTDLNTTSTSGVLLAVGFYWMISITLVFVNKDVMKGETPIFLTWTQIVFAVFGCFILSRLRSSPTFSFFPEFQYHKDTAIKVMPLTAVFLGMIVFNNLCLKYVQVSFYQVARSLTILFNVVFSLLFLGDSTSKPILLTLAVVVVGYILGCDGEIEFSYTGAVYGVLASAFVALYSIYVKKILKEVDNNKWLLVIYNNINALWMLPVVFLLAGELTPILENTPFGDINFWYKITIAGMCGFLINIATFWQIQVTSSLTHNISGTAKAAAQSMLAVVFLENTVTPSGAIGLLLVLGGSLLYAYIRMREAQIAKVLNTEPTDEEIGLTSMPTEDAKEE